MNRSEKDFIKGLAVGAAYLARSHGEPSYAKWIIEDNGYSRDSLIAAEVEDFDLYAIYPKPTEPKQTSGDES